MWDLPPREHKPKQGPKRRSSRATNNFASVVNTSFLRSDRQCESTVSICRHFIAELYKSLWKATFSPRPPPLHPHCWSGSIVARTTGNTEKFVSTRNWFDHGKHLNWIVSHIKQRVMPRFDRLACPKMGASNSNRDQKLVSGIYGKGQYVKHWVDGSSLFNF